MKPFRHIEQYRPNRSRFDLSGYHLKDCDMGVLYPMWHRKMVPGDHFRISIEMVLRMNPMVAPIMHEVNIFNHIFFCPLRIIHPKPDYHLPGFVPDPNSWEEFYTGGTDGLLEAVKPKHIPTGPVSPHGLWDNFGYPFQEGVTPGPPYPDAYPLRTYNLIYNEYYRDQNYMDPVDLDYQSFQRRCWEKDYFTSALPWQQRGQAPALPITGVTSATWPNEYFASMSDQANTRINFGPGGIYGSLGTNQPGAEVVLREFFNSNTVDLSNASTFDVNDLRLAFQVQKFLERNARAGGRYIEQLKARYGVAPRDERLQRPEYVGGTRAPIIVSEVLQTSSTDSASPQGNLAGHGMSVSNQFVGSYYAQEFGIIMCIMSIMPRTVYHQGMPREYIGETVYDEVMPEFVNLSEQPIYASEIYHGSNEQENREIFGFQGRYDEYRVGRNIVSGKMRPGVAGSLGFWHIARHFENRPALNKEFLICNPRKDFLAVPSERTFIVTHGIRCRAVRPLPVVGTPGLIDHH